MRFSDHFDNKTNSKTDVKSREKNTVLLVMTVGTTLDPLIFSLEEELKQAGVVKVLALYGAALPSQKESPLEVTTKLRARANELGCEFIAKEVSDPNNFDKAFHEISDVLRNLNFDTGIGELVFNITGATKAMASALAVAATTTDVCLPMRFAYVGGNERDETGRVYKSMELSSAHTAFTRLKEQEAVRNLKALDFTRALLYSEKLQDRGRTGFLKQACHAFYLWDSFQYKQSNQVLAKLKRIAQAFLDDSEYSSIAQMVLKVEPLSKDITILINLLNSLKDKDQDKAQKKLEEFNSNPVYKEAYLRIVADCFVNANRYVEKIPVEAVMRAYRAIELAVKFNLIERKINPDNPAWDELSPVVIEKANIENEPLFIMLDMGVRLLRAMDFPLTNQAMANIKDVQKMRNECYLEHGFAEVSKNKAKQAIELTGEALRELLPGKDLDQLCAEVTLEF
ncbi:MAG: hypothetical protein QME63_03420 [Actinomycetota bacterium]|nr:hypothetical protein [Actinomycetota bacterium]